MKVEEQVAKEKEARLHLASGGDKRSDEFRRNQGESNLTQVESKKEREPQTDEIMAKKAGFKSKNTWKDAKLIVTKGTP